jgi:hypothetical protein
MPGEWVHALDGEDVVPLPVSAHDVALVKASAEWKRSLMVVAEVLSETPVTNDLAAPECLHSCQSNSMTRGFRFAAAACFVAVPVCAIIACRSISETEDCFDTWPVRTWFADGGLGVNITGQSESACEVIFTNPDAGEAGPAARYHFDRFSYDGSVFYPSTPPEYRNLPPCAYTVGGEQCTVVSGPAQPHCWRSENCLDVELDGAALIPLLGGPEYTLTITCGGTVVVSEAGVVTKETVCAL